MSKIDVRCVTEKKVPSVVGLVSPYVVPDDIPDNPKPISHHRALSLPLNIEFKKLKTNSIFEAYTALYLKKIETETELAVAKTTLSIKNPTIMQLEKLLNEQIFQLDQLMIKLDEKLQYLLSNITPSQVDAVPNIEFSVSFNSLPSLGLENGRLIREVELQSTIQELLIPQFEQAKLEETKNIPTLQVIDKPKVAINKAKPKRALIVIGATLMSILISIIFIYTDHHTRDLRTALKRT